MTNNAKRTLSIGALVIVVVVAFVVLATPDQRTGNEKVGDAVGQLDEGLDDAARELEDRTPAERLSDEYEDATDGDPN